jgi:hypothetical protein
MSLHHLAQTLKHQGRGKDTELIHMTKGEIAGLHALARAHGGSLTTNPHTGLPEAGFLDTILSIGGGLVGGMVGGPMGAAIGSGLGSYLGGANPQQALMSGVLSYGLGGLGEGVEKIGGEVLGNEISAGAQTAADAARESMLKNFSPDMSIAEEEALRNSAANAAEEAGSAFGKVPSYMDKIQAGLGKVAESPLDFAKGNLKYLGAAGLGALGKFGGLEQKPLQALQLDPTGRLRPYSFTPYNQLTGANPYYTPLFANGGAVPYPAGGIGYPQQNVLDKTDFYAQSTANPTPTAVVGAAPKTDYDARITQQGDEFKAAAGAYVPKTKSADIYKETFDPESAKQDADLMALIDRLSRGPTRYAAQGGLASLGEYAAGGKLLKGPGDGMSDSIPAVIKGPKPQRAALAQGEFVIPADVVSHLGNGSTDAGAKRLYSMMDKIRMARTGSKKQGRQINPAKFMPA